MECVACRYVRQIVSVEHMVLGKPNIVYRYLQVLKKMPCAVQSKMIMLFKVNLGRSCQYGHFPKGIKSLLPRAACLNFVFTTYDIVLLHICYLTEDRSKKYQYGWDTVLSHPTSKFYSHINIENRMGSAQKIDSLFKSVVIAKQKTTNDRSL